MNLQPKNLLLVLLVMAVSTWAQGALSIVDIAGNQINEMTYDYGEATVTSTVYEVESLYLYTYVIDNPTDSTQIVSWFSVDVTDGTEITSIGYDVGTNIPAIWHEVVSSDDSILSIDGLFTDAIESGETSTLLYFLSPVSWDMAMGHIGGTGGAVEGQVIAPVHQVLPEPASLLILSVGALVYSSRKK